jgi:hypothetical protein
VREIGKITKWFRTPKATPLQLLILVGGMFYFIYISNDLFKVFIYIFLGVVTILSGYSFIDSRKLAWNVRNTLRRKDMPDKERIDEALSVIDDALYDLDRKVKKRKRK